MKDEIKKTIEEYKMLTEKLGIKEKPFTNEEGKIIFLGKRWVMLDVDYFPEFMIQVTEKVVGPIAKEFIYWFGYAYGEKIAERQVEKGIPKEYVLPSIFALSALFTGWSIIKIDEMDLEKGYLKAHSYNNFEIESGETIGRKSEVKFGRGVVDGIFSVLVGAKTQSTLYVEKDVIVLEVIKR